MSELPRIKSIAPQGMSRLQITWADGRKNLVDLTGWIARGRTDLAVLKNADRFATAEVVDWGATVQWPPEGDDLTIDAHHLALLAEEQRPFVSTDLVAWQARLGLSNQEAADIFGVALSTWSGYRAGAAIPAAIAMACRGAERDPILLEARFRPRQAGRPTKVAAGA